MLLALLRRLAAICSRLLSLIILPAQLPGDLLDLLEDLQQAPLQTIRGWSPRVVFGILTQLIRLEKLTIPNDSQLERMATARRRYLQRGWTACPVRTRDGVSIDAILKEPPDSTDAASGSGGAPRFVIFVGGNSQRYEDWLPYYEVYARDVGCGFLAFNFRGVGNSGGAVLSGADLVCDVSACVDHLLRRGVQPHHILLHGFSLGGAVAALHLASHPARGICLASDRSFRSLSRTAFGLILMMVHGPAGVAGGVPTTAAAAAAGDAAAGGAAADGAPASRAPRFLSSLVSWVRGAAGWIAVCALRACAWDLRAETAWPHIGARKVLVYHPRDNVIHYATASLHALLARTGRIASDPTLSVIEVRRMGHKGWPAHDFPLCVDQPVWTELVRCVRAALQMAPASSASQ